MQIQVHNIVFFQLSEVPRAQGIPALDIDIGTSSSECGILSPGYSELSSFQTSESGDVMDISVDSTSDSHDQSVTLLFSQEQAMIFGHTESLPQSHEGAPVTLPPAPHENASETHPPAPNEGALVTLSPALHQGASETHPPALNEGALVTLSPALHQGASETHPPAPHEGASVTLPPALHQGASETPRPAQNQNVSVPENEVYGFKI